MSTKSSQLCDRVGVVSLSLSVFLAIVAFLPGGFMPSGILKGYLVVITVLVGLVAWLVGRLIEGTFRIPWSPLIGASAIFVVVLFLSALFSHTGYAAFFGESFEQGTFAVIAGMLFMTFLVAILFSSRSRIMFFLKGFFGLYIVLALFQLVHVIFPSATALGVLTSRVDTPVGNWGDFAFLSGAVLVGLTLLLQFVKLPRTMRIVAIVGASLSLFFVILCNILTVWILVGISAVLILVYTLITNRNAEERRFPFLAFLLSLFALLFVWANNLLGGILANLFKASFLDVHPSLTATLHVAGLSLRTHPIFGSGPNSFMNEWLINRPSLVNTNSLWDTPFSAGSSYMATVGILGGALGVLSVIFFLGAFAFESIKKVFSPSATKERQLTIFCMFLMSLYFVLAITLFSPGIAIITAAFFFIGMFLAVLVGENLIPVREFNFLKDQRASFFAILCIIALLMVSAGIAYSATERFGAIVFYQKGINDVQAGSLDSANTNLDRAIALADLPSFERTKVLVAEQSIQKTLNVSPDSASPDVIKSTLQNAISLGNAAATQAVNLDPSNPANYLTFGDLLRMVVPLKVDGAMDRAKEMYTQAIALAPNYPKSYLSLAELYFDSGDNDNAKIYAQKAIDLKANYTDAFFLMSQIEVAQGDTDAAVKRLQDATLFDPNNPDTYFELGVIRYQSGDYQDATTAFRSAIVINNQYLNAWYYLALTDQKLGNSSEATTILTALHNRLPDNKTISDALNGTTTATTPATTTTTTKTTTTTTKTTGNTSVKEKAKKLPVSTDTTDNTGN